MRVYYKPMDIPEQEVKDEALAGLPDNYIPIIKNIVKQNTEWQNRYSNEMREKWKYKIMWGLRSIESEIDEEGGCIIITENMQLQTKDFAPELSEKILALLKSIK